MYTYNPSTYDTPVKHLAINFGAPADKKDDHGTLWFGYPNPRTVYTKNHFSHYGVKFDLQETILEGMGYFRSNSLGKNIEGTNAPWLFTSGCTGLTGCTIPLTGTRQEPSVYTVRLGFCAPAGDEAGQRVFDVKLQDKIVLRNFDITRDAGQSGKAVVKELSAIPVVDNLKLELVPQNGNPRKQHAPVISFLEIIDESGSRFSFVELADDEPFSFKTVVSVNSRKWGQVNQTCAAHKKMLLLAATSS